MASIRKIAQCIGLSGQISIIRDFFGYWTGLPKPLSLLTQVRLLQGKHIHLNLIQVYPFSFEDFQKMDAGLQFMREAYAAVNFGVGRIKHYTINQGGYENIVYSSVEQDQMNSRS